LGLKHLAFRPKKQQLIDDNRHRIAKENANMMETMAKVNYFPDVTSIIHNKYPNILFKIVAYV